MRRQFRDLFGETVRLVGERSGRALLSGALVAVAVGCFVGLTVTVGSSQAAVDREFEALRPRDLRVESGGRLDLADDPLAGGPVPESVASQPSLEGGGRLWLHRTAEVAGLVGAEGRQMPVFAADPSALALVIGPSLEGRVMDDSDLPLAVISVQAGDRLGLGGVPLPFQLTVGGETVSVVGRVEASDRFPEYGGGVFVSPTWAITSLDPDPGVVASQRYRVRTADDVGAWAEVLPLALSPARPEGVQVVRSPDPERLGSAVSDAVRAVVVAVGVGFSLIGTFAIGANASAAVSERRIEIGTKSALGWSPRLIVGEVLAETMLVGSVASSVGAACGAVSGIGIAVVRGWPVAAPWWLAMAASAVGAVVGAVAGAAPARSAVSIDPALVLRGA